ncbi:hypothetical protein MRB53_039090 [Persea americana]|nr:hypothetical protein MRB53_039090 [Persea americana]
MADSEEHTTFRTLVTYFTDFLTVALHTILYERNVYPRTSFLLARRYNFPVRQNRHPKVCEWIHDAVAAVEAEMLLSAVARVAVVLFDAHTNRPRERFVFDLSRFPRVPPAHVDTPLQHEGAASGDEAGAAGSPAPATAHLPVVDLEEQLRALLSRLANCSASMHSAPPVSPTPRAQTSPAKSSPPPPRTTFTLAVELREDGDPPLRHPQPWIPSEQGRVQAEGGHATAQKTTLPLRAVSAGDFVVEAWVEEVSAPNDPPAVPISAASSS